MHSKSKNYLQFELFIEASVAVFMELQSKIGLIKQLPAKFMISCPLKAILFFISEFVLNLACALRFTGYRSHLLPKMRDCNTS